MLSTKTYTQSAKHIKSSQEAEGVILIGSVQWNAVQS